MTLVARAIGTKLSPFVAEIIPVMVKLAVAVLEVKESVNVDNELTESCLSVLEQISKHCPREISNDYINLFKHALELL